MRALAELKARGAVQECWKRSHPDCPRVLYADAPKGSRHSITLGHIIDFDARPDLFWDPSNHAPECMKCNYSGGAQITNRKRKAARAGRTVSTPQRKAYKNPRW